MKTASSAPNTSVNSVSSTASRIPAEKSMKRDVLVDREAVGQDRLDPVESPEHLVDDRDGVAARLLEDSDADGRLAVVAVPARAGPRRRPRRARRRTGTRARRPACAITSRSSSASVRNSASVFTPYSTFAPSTKPPGTSTCSRWSAASTSPAESPRARRSSPRSQIRIARSLRPNVWTPTTPGIVSKTGVTSRRTYSLASTSDSVVRNGIHRIGWSLKSKSLTTGGSISGGSSRRTAAILSRTFCAATSRSVPSSNSTRIWRRRPRTSSTRSSARRRSC